MKQGAEYYQFAHTLQKKFDIIVVDGLERYECAKEGMKQLTDSGVIILDNSVRNEYRPIYQMLGNAGFRHIDFFGMAPGSRKDNGTTVFYRANNCLQI